MAGFGHLDSLVDDINIRHGECLKVTRQWEQLILDRTGT
ncbi:unnamed protein product [Ectocarpus sp. 6 AP-2014]